jgi:hypothetical protein
MTVSTAIWKSCGVTVLVDELIKDKWIKPEDRFQEIAQIYKSQVRQAWHELIMFQNITHFYDKRAKQYRSTIVKLQEKIKELETK